MKLHRITALIARHLYLYRRSLPRIMEIFYWPFLDLVIWGFITLYLTKYQPQVPGFVTFFLGALILWDMLFRSQQGITIPFDDLLIGACALERGYAIATRNQRHFQMIPGLKIIPS